jgi:hypothetical protein
MLRVITFLQVKLKIYFAGVSLEESNKRFFFLEYYSGPEG